MVKAKKMSTKLKVIKAFPYGSEENPKLYKVGQILDSSDFPEGVVDGKLKANGWVVEVEGV